ncbi:MAG: hypothetical protein GXY05_02275 [Clostridiales bacterium]|nr:hypothetical protein [Clostridiales bacterium]
MSHSGNTGDVEPAALQGEKPVYNPSEIPVSGTPAFSVTPMPGITVSAEQNALDRERTFTAEPLTESEMGTLFLDRSSGDWVPVYAFAFDAGLEDTERLPGELNIELDMKKFDVEKDLWPYLKVIRLGDDGTVMELPTAVTDKGISFTTRQNSVLMAILTGFAIGIPVMAYIERGQDGLRELYPNEIFYEAIYPELQNANARYRVTYPKSMARTDSPELKALNDRMRALIERYGLDPDIPLIDAAMEACTTYATNPEFEGVDIEAAAFRLMKKIYNDKEYLSIKATFNDPQWQMKNLWTESVWNVCNRLARADDYLFDEREFRVPTHVIDVLVLDRWPHGAETLGVAKNLYTASPFIHINAKKALDMQNLLVTVTHELFHVVQSGYVYYESNNYTPFIEATAVLLEKEAFSYYSGAEQLLDGGRTDLLTDRNKWELFSLPLMTPSQWVNVSDSKKVMQEQGYVSSHWIEFLRDRYYPGDDFLKNLMERYAATIGTLDTDVHKILRDQTSSDSDVYCIDFRLFCIRNYEKFNGRSQYILPKPDVVTLSAETPHVRIDMPYQAFSVHIRDFKIENLNDKGEAQKYKILITGEAPGLIMPSVRFYQNDDYQGNITDDGMTLLPESTAKLVTAHEIEDYFMTTPGTTAGTGYEYELFLLLPPAAPLVEIDEEEDLMRVTPQGFSLGTRSSGYDVVVITPEGDKFFFPQRSYTTEAEIPLDELESGESDTVEEDPKYKVYLVEKVEFPDGSLQYGPDGEETELDDDLRFEDILGTYDMTQTVSGFDTDYLDDIVGQMEGVPGMEDYLEQYDEIMGNVDGTYSGTMVISAYQTGGEIAEVTFVPSETEYGTTYYRGVWDKGVLHLEPVGEILGGSWDLTFKKSDGKITCEGTSSYDGDMASYSYTLTAVKQTG